MKFNLIYKHTYIKTRQVHVTKHTEPYLEMDKSPRCEGAFLICMHRCGPARVRAVDAHIMWMNRIPVMLAVCTMSCV